MPLNTLPRCLDCFKADLYILAKVISMGFHYRISRVSLKQVLIICDLHGLQDKEETLQ